MTVAEKQKYISAVLALKNVTPSVLHTADPTLHRYDDYVELHLAAMMLVPRSWGHNAPAFYSWHRELLRHFESDLQLIDATVTIPYWDWQTDAGTGLPIWDPNPTSGLGTNGRTSPLDFKVMDGAFAYDAGNWTVRVKDDPTVPDFLTRNFTAGAVETLATIPSDQTFALGRAAYDSAPWADLDLAGNFARPQSATGVWRVISEYNLHNLVHRWIAGDMGLGASPNDPIFFLHHCNLDRLWSVWERQHPTSAPYLPTPPTAGVPTGYRSDDNLIFTDPVMQPTPPWPGQTTSASLVNHHALVPGAYWYDTDPPEFVSRTNSIDFHDVPQGVGGTGVTTYRAITLEVIPGPCNAVHFEIISGPTAGFGTPLGLSVDIPASESTTPSIGRLWLSYSSINGTIVGGSVVVRATARDPGGNTTWTDSWTVNVSANSVPRPKSAVALVLDRSGSMSEDAGDGNTKISKLREAVGTFVDVMQQGDGLAIVRFDHEANLLMGVTDVGATPATAGSGRALAGAILTSTNPVDTLDPRGSTSIGGGVSQGKLALDNAPVVIPAYSVRAMLVLTDGMENTPPWIADVAATGITANTFAIGFGTPQNISVAALNQLTQNHDGYLLVTGALTPGDQFRLSKYFLQILAGVNNQQIVLDPQGELVYGTKHRIPFGISEADYGLDVILLSPAPAYLDFTLETPDGRIVTPASAGAEPAVSFVTSPRVSYYRIALPALSAQPTGSHAGRWYANLSLGRSSKRADAAFVAKQPGRALPYNLLVHAYSCLQFRASLTQSSLEPAANITIRALLSEYDVPIQGRGRVWADVRQPLGGSFRVGMTETSPGLFEGTFVARLPGAYVVRVQAAGATFYGTPFQRETTLTAAVFVGGDKTADSGVDRLVGRFRDQVCQLLSCFTSQKAMDVRSVKRLAELGFNLDAVRECLKVWCRTGGVIRREGPAALPAPPQTTARPQRVLRTLKSVSGKRGFADLEKPEPVRKPERTMRPKDLPMFPSLEVFKRSRKAKRAKKGRGKHSKE